MKPSMLLSAIDRRIRSSFSEAAIQYDVLTSLHKEIGRELSRKIIDNDNVDRILDVGMGTGWLTNRLSFFLPESQIVGVDFAPGMVEFARKKWEEIDVIQADAAHLPFRDQTFDMIISNLAYQWVRDLPATFRNNHQVLKPGGKIYLTLFGYNTFNELFKSLEATRDRQSNEDLGIGRLPELKQVEAALKASGFKSVSSDYEIIRVHFDSMMSLVRWIKNIGANVLKRNTFVGKQWLARAEKYYGENYRDKFGVSSTFEVLWLEAQT